MAKIIYCPCGNVFHVGDKHDFHCRRCGREFFNLEKKSLMGTVFSKVCGKSTPDFIVKVKGKKKHHASVKDAYFKKKPKRNR